jgi:Mg-chelatase subunit ChlD
VPLQTKTVVSINPTVMLAGRTSITPKPKVSPARQSQSFDSVQDKAFDETRGKSIVKTTKQGPAANVRQITDILKESSQQNKEVAETPGQPTTTEAATVAGGEAMTERTEFFGSTSEGRRICYVVDCSGSMQGLWPQVRDELADSIRQLQPDQYFCVVVFGAGSILESGGGKMVRATEQAKKEAHGFIDSVRPRGATNATAALEHAIKVRDRMGVEPSLIYFLTDGFELSEQDNSRFAHQVATLIRSFAPKTKINTIGFWCSEQDSRMLETVANESGGQFTLIGQAGKNNDWDE